MPAHAGVGAGNGKGAARWRERARAPSPCDAVWLGFCERRIHSFRSTFRARCIPARDCSRGRAPFERSGDQTQHTGLGRRRAVQLMRRAR